MPKIHPNGLIFSFTPITIKPHTVKVYMKSKNFVLQVYLKNYFKYANELNTRPN